MKKKKKLIYQYLFVSFVYSNVDDMIILFSYTEWVGKMFFKVGTPNSMECFGQCYSFSSSSQQKKSFHALGKAHSIFFNGIRKRVQKL